MSNFALAVDVASGLESRVNGVLKDSELHKPQTTMTGAEIHESRAARERIQANIESIVTIINNHLAMSGDPIAAKVSPSTTLPVLRDPIVNPGLTLKTDTEGGLSSMVQTSQAMTRSIGTIMESFERILMLEDIDKFSGTLESVPPVGILDANIMYAQKKLRSDGQVGTQWQILEAIPNTPGPDESTILCSYNGNLYLAIGTTVYYKTPRSLQDPQILQAATDNWANMYNQGWSLSSQTSLPDANSRSLAPYNKMSADDQTLNSWLVRVANDFSLSYASGAITDNNALSFTALSYSPTARYPQPPQLQKAAYYMDSIWGYDSSNTLWELKPDFSDSTYKVASTESVPGRLSDLTAVDTGIVGAMADSNLWAREITPPTDPDTPNATSTATWKIAMELSGVQSLGAAAPGRVLDTRTLTAYLKSQYTDTQSNLIPVIHTILAFTSSHRQYLEIMAEQSAAYLSSSSTAQQQQLAHVNGKFALDHAKLFSNILSKTVNNAAGMVTDITRQTSQIKNSIDVQLGQIATSLAGLNATLKTQGEESDALSIELWASIASVVVGLGLIIGGFFATAGIFGAPAGVDMWMAGGAMVVGSFVAVGVEAANPPAAQEALQSTQSAIANLMEQQSQLQSINSHFDDLDGEYQALSSFWGNVYSTSQQINDIEGLGEAILSDNSAIQEAQDLNEDIRDNLSQYVDTLSRQGIQLPEDTVNFMAALPGDFHTMEHTELATHVDEHHEDAGAQKRSKTTLVERLLSQASNLLAAKDQNGYVSLLSKAAALSDLIHG